MERLSRDFLRTTLLCSSITLSPAAFLMSSPLTPPLERVFCLAWLLCWMCNRFRILPKLRVKTVRHRDGVGTTK